jgi:hypothetical protein
MAEKGKTQMADTQNKVGDVNPAFAEAIAALALKQQKTAQKLKVTDLTTGVDDAEITNNYVKYSVPEYDAKKYGPREGFIKRLMELALSLVSPVENQIDALLYRATQDSYQAGKVAAYATGTAGQYLSPELKAAITMVVKQGGTRYADASNSEAFAAWKAAFTSQASFDGKTFDAEQIAKRKAGADRTLATAQALSDSGADSY